MVYKEKLRYLYSDLGGRGLQRADFDPPLHRIIRMAGVRPTPPHFLSFASLFLYRCIYFAIFWGTFMWIFVWRHQSTLSILNVLVAILFFGIPMGLFIAKRISKQAENLDLPPWDEYPRTEPES